MKAALAWFNRANPHDSRIAVVGGRPGFKQYVFYGNDLSNHVQYVARHGPHGAYLPIASEAAQKGQDPRAVQQCEEWRRALNDGDYRYLIVGPDQRTQSLPPIEAALDGDRPGGDEPRSQGQRHRLQAERSTQSRGLRARPTYQYGNRARCPALQDSRAGTAADDQQVSFGDYLFGVVGLAAVAIPMALAAVRLRRRLLPGWEGAPARLAEAVLGVALLTVLLQLLGAFGILVPAVLIVVVSGDRPRPLVRRA